MSQIRGAEELVPPGRVPMSWLQARCVGEASISGVFADIGHSQSIEYLRIATANVYVPLGLTDLDAGTIRLRAPRRLTQEISGHDTPTTSGGRFLGIRYAARFGDELINFVLFETASLTAARSRSFDAQDADFQSVCELFDLDIYDDS